MWRLSGGIGIKWTRLPEKVFRPGARYLSRGKEQLGRPDSHLSPEEIDVLLRSGFSGQDETGQSEGDAAEARRHLAACDICSRRMDMHSEAENRLAQLRVIAQAERGRECPPRTQWLLVTGGLLEATEAQELTRHAAECDHCGPLLRESLLNFADQLTPDEEILLGGLESSQASWQLAVQILKGTHVLFPKQQADTQRIVDELDQRCFLLGQG